jgi:hypothetical protein
MGANGDGLGYEANRERILAAYAERTLRAQGLRVNPRWLAELLRRRGIRAGRTAPR